MTDVMRRCVPVSTGALSPDLRVSYQFGLVLGVDEFEQEDLYFRERDERATRALHGSGTAAGLHVTAARPIAAPADVEVRVEPGIAADQHGRPVVIPAAQCARVGAWLAAEERLAAGEQRPSPLLAHLRPSGDVSLSVVVEHATCPDALVPLPGNACGSDDDVTAPSRIRDSWQLGFRWEAPAMAHWDGVRALADVLAPVDLHDGSLLDSDEAALAAHIRALAPGAPPPAVGLPAVPVLPRADARAALDRLLTVWVTEVRPALQPDLLRPAGEAAVLLSTITVVPAAPFDPAAPAIAAFAAPDDEGRPYLAPTQLLQELAALGGGVATILAGSPLQPAPPPPPQVPLASLTERGQGGARRLLLWDHLPEPLVLPASVEVVRDGGAPVRFSVAAGPVAGTFALAPPAGALGDGELLEVRLELPQLGVRDVAAGVDVPLPAWLQRNGLDLLGRRGSELRLHHVVAPAPAAPQPPPPARRVRALASARSVLVDGRAPGVELWWHVDEEPRADDERVQVRWDEVRVLAEVESAATPAEVPFDPIDVQHNVFHLLLDRDAWRARGQRSPYLRVVVPLEAVELASFGGNAMDYADALDVAWEDAQADGRLLALWVRMDVDR